MAERLVFDLPHCGEVLEVAWIMSEHLGDLALIYALFLIDVPVSESLLYQEVMNNRYGVPVWADVLTDPLEQRQDGPEPTLGSGNLPDCTASELDTINRMLADHYALYDAAGEIETLEGYVAFTEAQLAWPRGPMGTAAFMWRFLRVLAPHELDEQRYDRRRHPPFLRRCPYDDNPFWPATASFKARADVLLNRLRGVEASQ